MPSFPDGVWAVDFEYSREEEREPPVPVCMTALEVTSGCEIRLFKEQLLALHAAPFPVGENACIVAYASGAEGACFSVLGWEHPVNVIDPYAEHLLDLNGRKKNEGDTQLLEAMRRHGLPTMSHEHKEAMRDMARFQTSWTEIERVQLLDYCMLDNYGARDLLQAMHGKGLINWEQALWRGRYVYLSGSLVQHTSLPVDVETYGAIKEALPRLRPAILAAVDDYGIFEDGHLREARVCALIEESGLAPIWPLTEGTGRYKRDDKTWKEMATLHDQRMSDPQARRLMPLYRALSLLEQLEEPRFTIGSDGRNRFWTRPLLSKTGRNQPSTSESILAAAKVWRGLLTPPQGYALVEIDYSNEELWIAATQSGCPTLLREVASSDVHMTTALNVGLIAESDDDAKKQAGRERIKPFTHGNNYGISVWGVSKQLGIPKGRAAMLLRAFDAAHPVFRAWQRARVQHAYSTRRITAPMGWSMHVDSGVSQRTLLNWPMQTIGGEILRAAVVMLAAHGFAIGATAHDSVCLLVPLDDLEPRVALARRIMSSVTLPFTDDHAIPTKVKIVRPGERLLSPETRPLWEALMALARPGGEEISTLLRDLRCSQMRR
jgi:hypothetical protein